MQAEEYLQKNVRGILQPMVSAVLLEKPKDPVNIQIINIYFLINVIYIDFIHDTLAPELFRNSINRREHRTNRIRKP